MPGFIQILKLASDIAAIIAMAHANGLNQLPTGQAILAAAPALIDDIKSKNWPKLSVDAMALFSKEATPAITAASAV